MGLEAAVTVAAPGNCPVADASEASGAPVASVSRSAPRDDTVVEELELSGEADLAADCGMEEVFADDGCSVYRFERDADSGCVCDRIEALGCPVADVSAVDGRLRVVFRPADVDRLREIVSQLRDSFGGVTLEHLVRSGESTGSDSVVVDRGRLTDRQREVLETAYRMGYFEHPKGANGQEVAAELNVAPATFRGHLAAAQSKLFDELFEER